MNAEPESFLKPVTEFELEPLGSVLDVMEETEADDEETDDASDETEADDDGGLPESHILDLLESKCRTSGLCFGFALAGDHDPEAIARLEHALDDATGGELWVETLHLGRGGDDVTRILIGSSVTADVQKPAVVDLSDLDQAEECVENNRDLLRFASEPRWFSFTAPKVDHFELRPERAKDDDDAPTPFFVLDGESVAELDRAALEDALATIYDDDERPAFVLAGRSNAES